MCDSINKKGKKKKKKKKENRSVWVFNYDYLFDIWSNFVQYFTSSSSSLSSCSVLSVRVVFKAQIWKPCSIADYIHIVKLQVFILTFLLLFALLDLSWLDFSYRIILLCVVVSSVCLLFLLRFIRNVDENTTFQKGKIKNEKNEKNKKFNVCGLYLIPLHSNMSLYCILKFMYAMVLYS